MNIVETALVFVGIPFGLFLLIAAAVYGPTMMHTNRYRPGKPWTYAPVWYLPHPDHSAPVSAPGTQRALNAAAGAASTPQSDVMGGASGEW